MSTNDMQDTDDGNQPDDVTVSPEAAPPPEPELIARKRGAKTEKRRTPWRKRCDELTGHVIACVLGCSEFDVPALVKEARHNEIKKYGTVSTPADNNCRFDVLCSDLGDAVRENIKQHLGAYRDVEEDFLEPDVGGQYELATLIGTLLSYGLRSVDYVVVGEAILAHIEQLAKGRRA